jgi:hypothetical protein
MKKLYLLSILCLMTTGITFGMDNNNNNNEDRAGRKRSWDEQVEAVRTKKSNLMAGDSDDENPKPTNNDGFKQSIEARLVKSEIYNARCDLQDWVKFCAKNTNPNETANHIPVMWEFYNKIASDAAKNGYKQTIERSTLTRLAELTRACGLNPDTYKNIK